MEAITIGYGQRGFLYVPIELRSVSSPQRHFASEVDESTLQPVGLNLGASQRSARTPTSATPCVVSDLLHLCRASFMSILSQMVESSNLYEHKLLLPLHSFFQPKSREDRHVRKRSLKLLKIKTRHRGVFFLD